MGCWHVHALSLRDWIEADALHVGADLLRDFFEDLLGQVAHPHALVELHKLDNVSSAFLAARVTKAPAIAI